MIYKLDCCIWNFFSYIRIFKWTKSFEIAKYLDARLNLVFFKQLNIWKSEYANIEKKTEYSNVACSFLSKWTSFANRKIVIMELMDIATACLGGFPSISLQEARRRPGSRLHGEFLEGPLASWLLDGNGTRPLRLWLDIKGHGVKSMDFSYIIDLFCTVEHVFQAANGFTRWQKAQNICGKYMQSFRSLLRYSSTWA